MRKIAFLIFFSFTNIFFQNILTAQSKVFDETEIFSQGNKFFEQKNYDEAIRKFQLLENNGWESAELYFNLGNCFAQKKQWGKAILNYERALLLDPNDEIIHNNLKYVNDKTIDDIEKIPDFFLIKWWENAQNWASSGVWSIFGILALWGSIAGLILWILGKERSQRKRGFIIGWSVLIASLLFFALAYSRFSVQQNSGAAIIMVAETPLKTLPDDISPPILQVHEGTKVKIIEKLTSWYKVRLENGEIGWISESAIEKI